MMQGILPLPQPKNSMTVCLKGIPPPPPPAPPHTHTYTHSKNLGYFLLHWSSENIFCISKMIFLHIPLFFFPSKVDRSFHITHCVLFIQIFQIGKGLQVLFIYLFFLGDIHSLFLEKTPKAISKQIERVTFFRCQKRKTFFVNSL